MEARELKNRVAIVTAGGQGIGRAVATLLSDHGARVVVNDVSEHAATATAKAICERGGEAIAQVADVTDVFTVDKVIRYGFVNFSRIDILVDNAGVLRPTRLPGISETEWDLAVVSHRLATRGGGFLIRAWHAVPALTRRPIGPSFPSLLLRHGSCNRRLRLLEKSGKRGCRRVSFPHRSDWSSRRWQIHHRFSRHHALRPQRLPPHEARSPRIYSQTNFRWDYNLQAAGESDRSAT
jgi:NAD(P)-dependent dehydrogenase (short-subunit alcohol dehydrogenase family)